MTREDLLQDIAYARTLAEEGRSAPLIGGAYLVLFGMMLAIAYCVQWAAMTGLIPMDNVGWLWIAFGAAALIGTKLLRRRTVTLPGGSSAVNRADRLIWQGVVWAIMAVVVGTVLRGILRDDDTAPSAIMAAGFGLYGVALFVTARMSGLNWLAAFAWIAWLLSAALWFFANEAWAYLLAAGGCVAVLLTPGVIMMRQEPTTTV